MTHDPKPTEAQLKRMTKSELIELLLDRESVRAREEAANSKSAEYAHALVAEHEAAAKRVEGEPYRSPQNSVWVRRTRPAR